MLRIYKTPIDDRIDTLKTQLKECRVYRKKWIRQHTTLPYRKAWHGTAMLILCVVFPLWAAVAMLLNWIA